MNADYLGDSYDFVKRFWADSPSTIAPLFAHPHFIPQELRREFNRATNIQILDQESHREIPFGLFLDPDIGIPRPASRPNRLTIKHVPLVKIAGILKDFQPEYLICFDQCFSRSAKPGKILQEKMCFLSAEGISCFYHDSHARFLFIAKSLKRLSETGGSNWGAGSSLCSKNSDGATSDSDAYQNLREPLATLFTILALLNDR